MPLCSNAPISRPQMIRLVTFALGGEGWLSFMGGCGRVVFWRKVKVGNNFVL